MITNIMGFTSDYSEDAPSLKEIHDLSRDAILEFRAPWCGHCQLASSAVQQVLNEQSRFPHIKVYDGKGKRLGREFKVKLWPTLILLHNGQEVKRIVRPTNAEQIRQLLND